MTERDRIREQLDRSFTGPGWHGPSFHEALVGVTAEQAAARPIGSAHTIWEMVLHVASWKRIVRRRLAGESPRVADSDTSDWPPVTGLGEAAWLAALAALDEAHRELTAAVARLDDDRLQDLLEQQPVAGHSTVYVQLHGVALHDVYHAGQIMMLRRA
jgi:uncharacterized damage-inducible protein DinB